MRTLHLMPALLLAVTTVQGQTGRPILPVVAGWTLTIEPTVYKPDNLWDLIDGAADLYLEYNFVDLRLGRYINRDSVEVKVELYHHGSHADAFGIYSQERYPDYHFLDLGVQGYREKGLLNFLAGPYYIKISSVQAGDEVQDGMLTIARSVESHLRQSKMWPRLLAAFPLPGRIVNTEQYIAKSFLGYSFLNGAYTTTYEDGESFKSFLIETASVGAVKELVTRILEGIKKSDISKLSNDWLKVTDPHNGVIQLGWKDQYLFGIYADEKGKSKEGYLRELERYLSSMK